VSSATQQPAPPKPRIPRTRDHKLSSDKVRKALTPRREPYWGPLVAEGQYIGLRKINATSASWIARWREDDGRHAYQSLGYLAPDFGWHEAVQKAGDWFKSKTDGIKTDEVETVEAACRHYVAERRVSKSEACAHDAEKRFERTVYGKSFGEVKLAKIHEARVQEWRDGLGLSPGSTNRTLTALKAALYLAVRRRHVSASREIEWRNVKPLPGGSKRRDLFLDLAQRRALLKAATGAVRDLIEAVTLTGGRAGELVNATVSQFDARTKSMTFTGKTGSRTVPLSPAAVTLFERLAADKDGKARPGTERLLMRDDGKPWAHSDWDELVREAATAARLPAGTCLYTLRHSFITTALTKGLSTLDVARLVGTSVMMIEKHYGHLVASAARLRLAKVAML
jgi:integrase